MAKESRHHRDERKKPMLSLKEKRARKHEKKHPREIPMTEGPALE